MLKQIFYYSLLITPLLAGERAPLSLSQPVHFPVEANSTIPQPKITDIVQSLRNRQPSLLFAPKFGDVNLHRVRIGVRTPKGKVLESYKKLLAEFDGNQPITSQVKMQKLKEELDRRDAALPGTPATPEQPADNMDIPATQVPNIDAPATSGKQEQTAETSSASAAPEQTVNASVISGEQASASDTAATPATSEQTADSTDIPATQAPNIDAPAIYVTQEQTAETSSASAAQEQTVDASVISGEQASASDTAATPATQEESADLRAPHEPYSFYNFPWESLYNLRTLWVRFSPEQNMLRVLIRQKPYFSEKEYCMVFDILSTLKDFRSLEKVVVDEMKVSQKCWEALYNFLDKLPDRTVRFFI